MSEFLKVDPDIAESSLPPPLQALMTERNTLLQTGERHAASRRMISPVLDLEALKTYLPTIEARATEYIDSLSSSDSTFLAKDLTKFCLQLFAEIFTGHRLTDEQEKLYTVYNGGLFALSTLDPAFLKARRAREILEEDNQAKFEAARSQGLLNTGVCVCVCVGVFVCLCVCVCVFVQTASSPSGTCSPPSTYADVC